jgi:hypothetical protein
MGAADGRGPIRSPKGWSGRSKAIGLAIAIVLLIGGVLLISSGSSGDTYAECKREVQPTLASMQGLGSHLDVGMVQADYAAEVGDVQATFDRLNAKHAAASCQPVVLALGEAMDAYASASSEWNECIFSEEEWCVEEGVQELWANADHAIASAKQRLTALTEGAGAIAAAESEAEQVEADAVAKEQVHSAQVALETYATENEGSYEGATSAKLRGIEPSLPSSLQVAEAGLEYFSISVPSKGANWFTIDREIGGELDFRCGQRGEAGCPGNGHWG